MSMQSKNNYTPDVLDCLANLSNDEVFTSPAVVNQMLDAIPQEVFMSKKTTFLDPFTKTGIFLREITKRLLENQVPNYKETSGDIERITKEAIQNAVRTGTLDLNDKDYETKARKIGDTAIKSHPESERFLNFEVDLQAAIDHILTNQVYGIAITELTAQLARRSLYCSKDASGRYSVAGTAFGINSDGNIRFVPMKHTWDKVNANGTSKQGASCTYCGAAASNLDRPDELESHAYEFIHKDIEKIKKEYKNMEFTVIAGNPPYQLSDGGSGNGISAKPIYQLFVQQAKRLNPKYLTMIIPSRWYAGGKGLDEFRDTMLHDKSLKTLVDYPNSADCFAGVDIAGGVCYFLRDASYNGKCHVTTIRGTTVTEADRDLDEYDIFIRSNESLSIIKKVRDTFKEFVEDRAFTRNPFGFVSKERGQKEPDALHKVKLIHSQGHGYVSAGEVTKNAEYLGKYKVTIGKLVPSNGEVGIDISKGYNAITHTRILYPNEVITDSYLVINTFDTEEEARNFSSYMMLKFPRFLMHETYSSMNISKGNLRFVPHLDFTRTYTDKELYSMCKLNKSEIEFIEGMMRVMEVE